MRIVTQRLSSTEEKGTMSAKANIGKVDQYLRIVVGLALVAFAFQDGLSVQGWHWAGLSGFVFLFTAFFRMCPLYSALDISTCSSNANSRKFS
jgi:hypothetical protein